MPIDLQEYRRDAERFVDGAREGGLRPLLGSEAGLRHRVRLRSATRRSSRRTTVSELDRLYALAQGDEKRRLAYLLAFAVDGYMGAEIGNLSDEVANTEGQATITVDGEEIGLRAAPVVLANEADRARRARIQEARMAATVEHLNPLLDKLWRRCHELARGLGRAHYMALFEEVRGMDYLALRAKTDAFLHDTAGLYERSMDRLSRERLGLNLDELRYADIPYLWRAPSYDDVFTADRLVPTLRSTLAGMGIDLDAQTNVHLDTEVRELKTPRAFCCPVRVPDEVYLVVLPRGGQDDYAALLHEAGHTEHFAHVAPDLAFEYRHFGDNAVTGGLRLPFRPPRAQPGVAEASPRVRGLRRLPALRDGLRPLLPAALRGQALLRDGAPHVLGVTRRDGDDLPGARERGDHDRRARRELPDRCGRRVLRGQLPARVDARGRLAHDVAGSPRVGSGSPSPRPARG